MENRKNIVLTMEYADGTRGIRELLSIYKADSGRNYAALLPLNEDETVQENASVELVRINPYTNDEMEEDYIIEEITTEAELQTATEAFERLDIVAAAEADGTSVENLPTISFKNGNGQFEDWKMVAVFDHKNRKYVALLPMSDVANHDSINIHLMRIDLTVQEGVEGCEVTSIPSDMEYEEVASIFQRRMDEVDESTWQHPGVVL